MVWYGHGLQERQERTPTLRRVNVALGFLAEKFPRLGGALGLNPGPSTNIAGLCGSQEATYPFWELDQAIDSPLRRWVSPPHSTELVPVPPSSSGRPSLLGKGATGDGH
eukprot:Skav214754  [mRNA]  locus=scaffold983:263429:265907:- [translate_table: standard]